MTAEGIIERRKPREGESMREVSTLIRGSGGLPREILKIRLPQSAFPCYFQVIFINLAGRLYFFFCQFQEVAGSKTAGAIFFCGIILSLLLIQEGQLSVSDKRMYTVLVNHLCISLPRKCDYVN